MKLEKEFEVLWVLWYRLNKPPYSDKSGCYKLFQRMTSEQRNNALKSVNDSGDLYSYLKSMLWSK